MKPAKNNLGFIAGLARASRVAAVLVATLTLTAPPGWALVSIDDGRNQLYVSANFSAGHDSNILANANSSGDDTYSLDLGAEFIRRAGLIGLNSSVGVNATRYRDHASENFQNPRFNAEFTKQTGRTTGALTLSAARESRADTDANLRSVSWNYASGLNFKYPVIERYYFTGNLGYSRHDYVNNPALVDLDTFSAGLDLFYVFTTDRDLLGGYRYRRENTSAHSFTTDHAFTVGMTGRLIGRLNGSLRAGYELRVPSDRLESTFSAWTANASATWTFTKRFSLTGQLAKDFSTTSTNVSVDVLSTALNAQFVWNAKTTFSSQLSWSDSQFLGTTGHDRHDNNFSWSAGLSRILNNHLQLSLNYLTASNRSTEAISEFRRNAITFTTSARY
jgi:outer membrane receptor protein involved in Fe transport